MKISWRTLIIIFLLISIPAFFITSQIEQNPTEAYRIGMVLSTLENPFFQSMKNGAQNEADLNQISLIIRDSNNNSSQEYEHVKALIDKGIDLLIINPTDSDSVYQSVRYANLNKIPVITVDRTSTGGQIIAHISSNNKAGGALAADYLIQMAKNKGKYAEIKGIEGTSASISRGEGFNDRMISSNMTLAATITAHFDRKKGAEMTARLLNTHPDLTAIFAQNDEMALGALETIEARGLKIIVIGFDGTIEAINAVKSGKMTATISQQPEKIGEQAIQQALSYKNKQSIPSEVLVEVKLIKK